MSLRVAWVLAMMMVAACAGQSPEGKPSPSFKETISREELQQLKSRMLYDAIRQLRPRWLEVRGGPRSLSLTTDVYVFEDRALLGTTDVLSTMGTEGVYAVRYVDGHTATATLPGLAGKHVAGVIIVSMKAPRVE